MLNNLSINIRFQLYFLLYHFFIIFLLLLLFFYTDVNFELIFNYKILFNPLAYKSVLYYLYGYFGYLGIIFSHIIVSFYIVIALFYNKIISKRILLIHGFIPIYGSIIGRLFYEGTFSNFGFFGEIVSQVLMFYLNIYYVWFFYLLTIFLIILIVQLKNILYFLRLLYFILEKIKIIKFFQLIYKYFISWLVFFIPFFKKYYDSKRYININNLINRSIYADFYKISEAYNIETIDFDIKNNFFNEKKNVLPYMLLFNNSKDIKKFSEKVSDADIELIIDTFNYFNLTMFYNFSIIGPLVNMIIFTPDKNVKLLKINQVLPDIVRIVGKTDMRLIYPVANYPHSIALEYCHNNISILNFLDYAYDEFFLSSNPLNIILGVNTIGIPFYIDIAKAPHILLAGTTGSGKSNILNLFIVGLIWKNTVNQVQLILLDPKKSEFFLFQSIPHLLFPIAQNIIEIENAINNAVLIMEERYELLNKFQCKNIYEYNLKYSQLTFIVIIIDEYADIIIQSKNIELKIIRLLQMSRAAGIHVIVATQRPSADIISSIVKSNLPLRICCKVVNSINSRIVLDMDGAEKLLGNSDMLLFCNNQYDRVHGLFIDSATIELIVNSYR